MQPLMLGSGIYGPIFVAALAFFALQQGPALRSTLRLLPGSDAYTRDRGSWLAVQVLVVAGVVLGYEAARRVSGATIAPIRPAVFFVGIAFMLLGSTVSWIAVRQLGRYFTVVVAIRRDQPVVQSGLYRYLRHPSYAGQLLVFLGVAVTFTNWLSIPAVMLPVTAGYMYRILVEERALRTELGTPYVQYMGRTRRLIPFVW